MTTSNSDTHIHLYYCQHPTASQHRSSRSSISNFAVIRHEFIDPTFVLTFSNKLMFNLANTLLFAYATRKLRACELQCWVLHTRTKSANYYGGVIANALISCVKMADLRGVVHMVNNLVSRIDLLSDVSEIGLIVELLDFLPTVLVNLDVDQDITDTIGTL